MKNPAQSRRSRSSAASFLLTVSLSVCLLYFGKPVLVPLALAVLLTFIFTPLVSWVQRSGLSRVPAVLVVVLAGLLMAGGTGWGVYVQLEKLAESLPADQARIQVKIDKLSARGGLLSRLSAMFDEVTADKPKTVQPTTTPSDRDSVGNKLLTALMPATGNRVVPTTVVVSPAKESSFQQMIDYAGDVSERIATTGLVLILVVFMLIRREDLRNRMIGLLGRGRLTGTTRVTVEAAQRLSKYLLSQLIVNASFGLVFGLALMKIGVPYALLWGFVTAVLRFVPYVGTWAAASAPILLSFATSPGWAQPITVFVVFFILDLVTANAIEPVLFGHSTGVSPVALLIAAAFWTWIWGPVGLVLSTPLTVCLVVLGQHVPRFRMLSLLLGDQPALNPDVSYYQRLLAGDRREATTLVMERIKQDGLGPALDGILMPALRRVRHDRLHDGLTADDERFIFDSTEGILSAARRLAPPVDSTAPDDGPLVQAFPSHHRAEELSILMLADLLGGLSCSVETYGTRLLPKEIESLVRDRNPAVVFIAVSPPGGVVQARYLCRRLRKMFPHSKIIIGYWGQTRNFDALLKRLRASGANYVTTSLQQSRLQIASLLTDVRPTLLPEQPRITGAMAGLRMTSDAGTETGGSVE